jgi:hypothetical protein
MSINVTGTITDSATGAAGSFNVTITLVSPVVLQPPAVVPATFTNTLPVAVGQLLATLATTGGVPTSFAITAGNTSGYFAIDNTGRITVTAAGVKGLVKGTYTLQCVASNSAGSG